MEEEAGDTLVKGAGQKYSTLMRVLHWVIAVIILTLIGVGWWMTGLADDDPVRGQVYGLHKSFGVLVLLLVALRFVVRLASKVPPLPDTIAPGIRKLAHGTHYLLYLFMFIVPISGYVMSDAGGYPVKLFGFTMPDFFEKDKAIGGLAHELHEILPYVLLGLILLHLAGALKHRFFEKPENDVLRRML